ncbi:MAG: hypothetical protein JW822_01630 [Spirochaetales bacterium]|nr:hypothetical protein [Spirochaetales bacterium]
MKKPELMHERIKRVKVLFKELGLKILDSEHDDLTYTAGFEGEEGLQGGVFIDRKSKFLEVSFTFFFSHSMVDFVQQRLEDMLKVCYEYGCYLNLDKTKSEICFSVFSKLYFSGLNYYSLKQSLKDFAACVRALTEVLEIKKDMENEDL